MKSGFNGTAFRRALLWGVGIGLVLAVISAVVDYFKWDGTWLITFVGFAAYGYLGWQWSTNCKSASEGTGFGISVAFGLAVPSALIGVIGIMLEGVPVTAPAFGGEAGHRLLLEVPYMATAVMTARLHGTQNAAEARAKK